MTKINASFVAKLAMERTPTEILGRQTAQPLASNARIARRRATSLIVSEEGDSWGEISPGHIEDDGWIQQSRYQHYVCVQEVQQGQRDQNITDCTELDEKAAKCEETTP